MSVVGYGSPRSRVHPMAEFVFMFMFLSHTQNSSTDKVLDTYVLGEYKM